MPIARVPGCSTRAGRLLIGPAGCPLMRPSATTIKTTALLRGSAVIRIANTMQLATRTSSGRLVRSAIKPPSGTEITASHKTMLIVEPAAAIDQPRSTSIEGPNEKITAKPTLNKPQIKPAAIIATAPLRSRRKLVVEAAATPGDRYAIASSTMQQKLKAATLRWTALTP